MKKYMVMSLALMLSTLTFAQKKELKSAEKAIKNNDFSSAKASVSAAEALMSAMDDKLKAKFYLLKGQALYAMGAGNEADVNAALKSFDELETLEQKTGKKTYTPKADALKLEMSKVFIEKAQNALGQKNYEVSYKNFESAYRVSKSDTLYLYNAALLATSGQSYDKALEMFAELQDLGYTGISTEYLATDKTTGEEQSFPSSGLRDISVKAGTHEKSRNKKSESKAADIAKNIALIYIDKGENDKAIAAIEDAKKINPNDFNLLVSEANVRYKLGQKDEYRRLISKALELEPDNIDLLFNLGVVAGDSGDIVEAKKYYDMAIEMDPTYTRAYMNMAALILDQEQGILDEMSKLGMSAADDKKYDELKAKKTQLYKDAVPYLKSAFENDPNNLNAARTLMNIYGALDDTANQDVMKAKIEAIEN
ncbi:MAG: tetratricopeptide repeat protein [Flavobacteriaceae bacterium]|nr:tetratricopeptide repeat protein [Flavobacteriaceae bacterium]